MLLYIYKTVKYPLSKATGIAAVIFSSRNVQFSPNVFKIEYIYFLQTNHLHKNNIKITFQNGGFLWII
mgnify:CR=1 FL=1|jgi:hypothetical protein